MHQLSSSETALLAAETNTNLGHQSLCLELAPDSDGQHLTLTRLRSVIEENMHRAPSLRRRVRHVPLELDDPWWIEDPHFDLDYHVRHLAVPGASDPDALEQLLARLHERPLDRNRPLWELYLIENPDGASILFVKVHIVLIEELGPLGPLSPVVAGPGLGVDGVRNGAWRPDMVPTDSDLLIKAAWSTVRSPIRSGRHLLQAYRRIPVVGEVSRLILAASNSSMHPVERARNDRPVPRVAFNRTVGAHRRVARVTLSVDRLREIRRQQDVRFHDVLLTVISGALRHWLVLNDELPSEPLVALTPLLVDADSDELGAALVPLATHRHDALRRLDDISASMSELTLELEPQSAQSISNRAGAPSALAGAAARLLITTGAGLRMMPPFNVYVVNIPGRDEGPIAGHDIVREHAMCPITDGCGLSISAISHDHRVDVTLVADRDLITDLEVLAERLEIELDVLHHECAAS
ncbi:wax ester/triacylglycerol synthase domain-containing protein [Ilumatobacter sp.]|uniref:wax ester/triacylglycerol synthase domain-containing protein n=1 Tax=Ilumatobacter sp. TaxID=1967498 RepID=UPI003AF94169